MLIFYNCLPMLHWSNQRPVVSTVPTQQEEFISTHFKLVLVNRGLKFSWCYIGQRAIGMWIRVFAHRAMFGGSILHGGPIGLFLVPASAP